MRNVHLAAAGLLTILAAETIAPVAAKAGPNMGLCIAIKQNLDACVRDKERNQRRYIRQMEAWEDWGYGPEPQPPMDCNVWLLQLQANRCL